MFADLLKVIAQQRYDTSTTDHIISQKACTSKRGRGREKERVPGAFYSLSRRDIAHQHLNPFGAPKPLPILNPSNFVPKTDFQ